MAYFNHSFTKVFLGTGTTRDVTTNPGGETATNPYSTGGFISTLNTTTETLSTLAPGYFGFFDVNYKSINPASPGASILTACKPLYLCSSSLLTNDKIGPFAGGYKETNKSKMINPKYIQQVYKVTTCVPKQAVLSIGVTPKTINGGTGIDPNNFEGGTTIANCPFEFLCGESYNLRIDIKGSPALRALNHNAYQTLMYNTGCCTGAVPVPVDATLVFIDWAKQIITNNYLKPFVMPVVYDQTGAPLYAPGTTVSLDGTNTAVLPSEWWTAYVSPGHIPSASAGMRLFGAFVDTKFGNCSFQITDFFEKEPIKLYASLVDYNGDPCIFEGICVYNDCFGLQGMGFGEQVVRDLILSQSYLQNFFATDIRVREITQGFDILNSVNRNSLYTRYFILHSVPRFNNPTGVFDNDRYMLEIIVPEAVPETPVGNTLLDTFLGAWLAACQPQISLVTNNCTYCAIIPD